MGLESIDSLRQELPANFSDRVLPEGFEDEWVVIKTDSIDRIEDDFIEPLVGGFDEPDPEGAGGVSGWDADFPGAPVQQESPWVPGSVGENSQPRTDSMAFYLPFHYYRDWWGIYLVWEGILHLARDINARIDNATAWHPNPRPAIRPQDLISISKIFLYRHEFFHHKSEVWATRTEIIHRDTPLYARAYEAQYRKTFGTDLCAEEAVANAYAYDQVKTAMKKQFNFTDDQRRLICDALKGHMRSSPPGYRVAAEPGPGGMLSKKKMTNGERRLAEEYWYSAFGGSGKARLSEDAWGVFAHAFTGITNKLSRTNYLIRRGSRLHKRVPMGRLFSLKDTKKGLKNLHCGPVREGGNHEIWQNLRTGERTAIPRHREIPRGTLRSILKDLGLSLSVTEFQQKIRGA